VVNSSSIIDWSLTSPSPFFTHSTSSWSYGLSSPQLLLIILFPTILVAESKKIRTKRTSDQLLLLFMVALIVGGPNTLIMNAENAAKFRKPANFIATFHFILDPLITNI
jgi:hypothetical protein